MTRLLGIDEGTSGVKAVLYDAELRPLRSAVRPKATRHPRPGCDEQDPDAVLEAVTGAVAEVLDGEREPVVAGLDHQGESVLAWDAETGRALSPIVVWSDKRGQAVHDGLAPDAARAVVERSGLPLDPYFSAPKLAWLLRELPAVGDAAQRGTLRLGTVDAWLSDRLGAGFATDASTASRTQLQALGGFGWDEELCKCFGIPSGALPAVGDSAGELGELRHPSWPVPVRLCARVVDQQAALAGAGCTEPGRAKATYGTGVFVLVHVGDAVPAGGDGLLPTVAWRIAGRTEYALDGGVFAAGTLVDWLAATLGLEDAGALTALAGTVPDTGGVRVLPALSGLGAPWWRPEARGVVAGLTAATRPAHLARAALEAIAWRVADIVDAAAGVAPVTELRVDGGLTRSALLLELQAGALGRPVRHATADATALGAAGLAAVGAGVLGSPAELGRRLAPGVAVAPGGDAAARRAAHAAWRTFVTAAAELR